MLASQKGERALAQVLGANTDLLLWIPKKEGAEKPDGQRPLQLPTCFRRLFGSIIMGIVGPIVEPQLTPRQASVRGGSCGPNITLAYQHLAGHTTKGTGALGTLWSTVLGDADAPVQAFCARHANPDIDNCPAVLLADQSKAFERLGIRWLKK
eukprot:845635-Heterocapsa_arctica.AAC.1